MLLLAWHLPTLNAQSSNTTPTGRAALSDTTNVPNWLWPLIWADLNAGEAAKKEVTNVQRQNDNLRGRIRADSLSRTGQTLDCQQCKQALPKAKTEALAGFRAAVESDRRFRNANTERWFWRVLAVGAAYFGIKSL